jgi:uncharacterized protein YndB with AHSA1/START domain
MTTNTVKLNRIIRSTSEKLYLAFLDPDAICKWLPPYGFTCQVDHIDAKIGGRFKMSFTNFTTQKTHTHGLYCL